jgi:hypothetical protein
MELIRNRAVKVSKVLQDPWWVGVIDLWADMYDGPELFKDWDQVAEAGELDYEKVLARLTERRDDFRRRRGVVVSGGPADQREVEEYNDLVDLPDVGAWADRSEVALEEDAERDEEEDPDEDELRNLQADAEDGDVSEDDEDGADDDEDADEDELDADDSDDEDLFEFDELDESEWEDESEPEKDGGGAPR